MAGLEGKILSDRYELRRVVGRGGMADVYEGFDPRFQRSVAIKVFKREDEDMLRRFIREAHLMARLSNPHLVSIYDSGESLIDGVTWYYLVMPFMEGGTLRARIRRSPLSLQEACRSVGEIAAALDYIHSQGIIHRDIKSSNVLLDAEGHCYLSDFGIARRTTDATQLTTTGNVLGTVDYIAPELFEINRRADARSDLYSLGVLLFEMVTGQLPFSAENQIALVSMHMNKRPPSPRSISQQISPQVERVILKGLEKKPEQRYSSATEFADAFCRAVNKKEERNGAGKRGRSEYPEAVVQTNLFSQASVPVLPPLPLAQEQQKLRLPPVAGSTQMPSVPPTQYVPPRSPHRPEPRKPARGSRISRGRAWITIGSMVAVLIVIGLLLFAVLHQSAGNTLVGTPTAHPSTTMGTQTSDVTPTATPNETATVQAIAAATATAQVEVTATAQAQATATVVAQATATAGVIQTATAGTPLYDDKLNDANNQATKGANWDGLNGFDFNCSFKSDGYHATQGTTGDQHACQEAANQYGDATMSVDMDILKGNSGGLFFRFSKTKILGKYQGYLFEVDSVGQYKISIFNGSVLKDWTPSSALNKGYNVKNTLQVIMHGSTLLFYANEVFLVSVTDTTYSSGVIALAAHATDTPTEVVYSNLKVYPSS